MPKEPVWHITSQRNHRYEYNPDSTTAPLASRLGGCNEPSSGITMDARPADMLQEQLAELVVILYSAGFF